MIIFQNSLNYVSDRFRFQFNASDKEVSMVFYCGKLVNKNILFTTIFSIENDHISYYIEYCKPRNDPLRIKNNFKTIIPLYYRRIKYIRK